MINTIKNGPRKNVFRFVNFNMSKKKRKEEHEKNTNKPRFTFFTFFKYFSISKKKKKKSNTERAIVISLKNGKRKRIFKRVKKVIKKNLNFLNSMKTIQKMSFQMKEKRKDIQNDLIKKSNLQQIFPLIKGKIPSPIRSSFLRKN